MAEKRFQGRDNITNEPIGMPNAKATEVVKYMRKMGFRLTHCSVEMLVKVDGTWKKRYPVPPSPSVDPKPSPITKGLT